MTLPAIDAHKPSGNRSTTAGASPDLMDPDILKKASLTNVTDAELELPQRSWLQKHLLLAAIRLVGKFRRHTGSCLMLTKDLCVKYGSRIYLVEAQSMIYVARHTTIPVPAVHLAFMHLYPDGEDSCTVSPHRVAAKASRFQTQGPWKPKGYCPRDA
jgi:hypothetical protein